MRRRFFAIQQRSIISVRRGAEDAADRVERQLRSLACEMRRSADENERRVAGRREDRVDRPERQADDGRGDRIGPVMIAAGP